MKADQEYHLNTDLFHPALTQPNTARFWLELGPRPQATELIYALCGSRAAPTCTTVTLMSGIIRFPFLGSCELVNFGFRFLLIKTGYIFFHGYKVTE